MKTNLKELREKTDKELQDLIAENKRAIRDFRFKLAAKQLKDVRDLRQVKKLTARLLTLVNERQSQTK